MTQFNDADRDTLDRILRWRRDMRHFRTDPVPEPLLEELHEAMELSPSVGNSRPWRVIRVESPDLRAEIRADFIRCNAEAAAGYQGAQRQAYDALKLAGLDRAPVWLAVFTKTDPAEGHGLGRATMPATLHQSTAMAIHTLWLAARVRGLGLGMVSILDPAHIGPLLRVPESWEFTALLCLGWPEFTDDTPLLHRAGWQANTAPGWEKR
ncbi:cob(II)yrinic acid a,c-diamide reductase [Paracoccus aminovorans]|uniref:Cob(II)yrinic acid a,c-diamide reductase n=1 Tax=Paracoccus aminovorans TaxID=34004 RepID=A0A1I3A2C2_9RHOB|nr:5,6-dimethylbenzimidazole synthase [Paracoccus aminovorans]CQR85027.1 cob(II)yrinic acid a,c-diamide reductase [Paracoccus aminovorans]SFH44257.1 cob(II)yrinic acid a,c-diamide reductase [Paracoccus aminovorans]